MKESESTSAELMIQYNREMSQYYANHLDPSRSVIESEEWHVRNGVKPGTFKFNPPSESPVEEPTETKPKKAPKGSVEGTDSETLEGAE